MLVDPATGALTSVAGRALRAHEEEGRDDAPVEAELFLHQIESQTPPTTDLTEVAVQLRASRRGMGEAARAAGAAAVATGTPVLVEEARTHAAAALPADHGGVRRGRPLRARLGDPRPRRRHRRGGGHPGAGRDRPVAAGAARAQRQLAVRPRRDTGYASWRYQTWSRWPSHGTRRGVRRPRGLPQGDRRLLEWGAALDDGMLYLDARPSQTYPTLEIRVADVCGDVEDAVLVTALARALVTTEADAGAGPTRRGAATCCAPPAGGPPATGSPTGWSTRAGSSWCRPARRSPRSSTTPGGAVAAGDLELVRDQVERLLARGNGATQQRRTFERTGSLVEVVADAVARTEALPGAAGDAAGRAPIRRNRPRGGPIRLSCAEPSGLFPRPVTDAGGRPPERGIREAGSVHNEGAGTALGASYRLRRAARPGRHGRGVARRGPPHRRGRGRQAAAPGAHLRPGPGRPLRPGALDPHRPAPPPRGRRPRPRRRGRPAGDHHGLRRRRLAARRPGRRAGRCRPERAAASWPPSSRASPPRTPGAILHRDLKPDNVLLTSGWQASTPARYGSPTSASRGWSPRAPAPPPA